MIWETITRPLLEKIAQLGPIWTWIFWIGILALFVIFLIVMKVISVKEKKAYEAELESAWQAAHGPTHEYYWIYDKFCKTFSDDIQEQKKLFLRLKKACEDGEDPEWIYGYMNYLKSKMDAEKLDRP